MLLAVARQRHLARVRVRVRVRVRGSVRVSVRVRVWVRVRGSSLTPPGSQAPLTRCALNLPLHLPLSLRANDHLGLAPDVHQAHEEHDLPLANLRDGVPHRGGRKVGRDEVGDAVGRADAWLGLGYRVRVTRVAVTVTVSTLALALVDAILVHDVAVATPDPKPNP